MTRPICRALLLITLITFFSTKASAQDGDIDDFLNENVGDAEKLIGAYISPFMQSVSVGMTQGWYNTAKPHKVAGFDLTFTVNAMTIPDDEMFYNVASLNLSNTELDPGSPDYRDAGHQMAPTVFGPDRTPIFRVNTSDGAELIEGPSGGNLKGNLGANIVPVPMAQLGFGLPKGFDIKFRFVPKLKLGDQGEFNLFGLGVMHDIKQWMPGIKTLPFDLSVFGGYTRMKVAASFDDDAGRQDTGAEMFINSATVQGIISKKISVLTLYGAVGYNLAKSNISLLGNYDINADGDFNDAREKDPLQLKYGASGPRITAGFRLKLAVITLHADYTLQRYSCLTAGFGIAVR